MPCAMPMTWRESTAARSVVARRALPEGAVLERSDVTLKKPGTGLPAERLGDVIGKKLARAVAADQVLTSDDVEGVS